MASSTNQATAPQEGSSAGPSGQDLKHMYSHMLQARAISERMWLLNRMGKAHLVVTCEGHEGAQVGTAFAIQKGHDFVLPYYRDIGVVLTVGMTAKEILLGVLNRAEDPSSGGRQMPSHWSHPDLRIISQSSVVATQLPHAVGIAHASRIKKEDAVAVVYFGDGATSKGDFHESMNWAALYDLPVVFICENNGYAISVPTRKQMSVARVADRAQAYGIPAITVDGADVVAVYETASAALLRARLGKGPTLIEVITYRYEPHTNNDDDSSYRSQEEVDEWRRRDPIPILRDRLIELGALSEKEDEEMLRSVQTELDEAQRYAEEAPVARPEEALLHVFGDSSTETDGK